MAAATKDTIYIDVDDEITSIIDKVRKSEHKIVALVLPKRAAMLQSSVNMKLLKRAADGHKKQLVLITNEAGLMPLAAAVGLHVAKTLQSKPEVPELAEEAVDDADEKVELPEAAATDEPAEDKTEDFDSKASAAKPIGELAGLAAADETIELDNTETAKPVAAESGKKAGKSKVSKALRVPNFDKFRIRLIIGVVVIILLIVGWIMANIILPKATVTVDTDTSLINSNLTINLDSTAKTLVASSLTVPAKVQQTQKSQTEQVPTTGQQNNGTQATGSVTLSLTDCSQSSETIPAGTGVSSNGLTFITQSTETLSSVTVAGKCKNSSFPSLSSATVNVTSQQAGSKYNIAPSSFNVAGFSDVQGASSSPMTGGTDDIINIVAQVDITNAEQKLSTQDTSTIKSGLQSALQSAGYYPLPDTFAPTTPTTTTSANVGAQATTVSVTEVTSYSMFGVKQSDLESLITADVDKQIDPSKQVILNDGFSNVNFNVLSQAAANAQLTMQVTATAGPQLNTNDLKTQIAGKKAGEVKSIISANPGVTNVTVHFSPFWVDTTPKKASKVTIQFVKTSETNANKN